MKEECKDIRQQLMFYMDNQLPDSVKDRILNHLKKCSDCMQYFNDEKLLKQKICNQIKDSYFCKCNVERLKETIYQKIEYFGKR